MKNSAIQIGYVDHNGDYTGQKPDYSRDSAYLLGFRDQYPFHIFVLSQQSSDSFWVNRISVYETKTTMGINLFTDTTHPIKNNAQDLGRGCGVWSIPLNQARNVLNHSLALSGMQFTPDPEFNYVVWIEGLKEIGLRT